MSCHGAHGEGRPELNAPRIGDLESVYIQEQLRAFADGTRPVDPSNGSARSMRVIAQNLQADGVVVLGDYVAAMEPELRSPSEAVEGGDKAWKSCAACHGEEAEGGTGRDLHYQDPAYLRTQLLAYRDGVRGGPGSLPLAMAMAAVMTEVDDDAIDQLVAHIGSMRPERPALVNPEVTVSDEEGLAAFADIYAVAQHPRCLNCHPAGDSPLQGDDSTPHTMNITRFSPTQGVHCSTCHPASPVGDGMAPLPPANPIWSMPPRTMAFEDRSPAELCAQLKDPEVNGGRSLSSLAEHVEQDHLLITSWHSGRTPPPISHPELVERYTSWAAAGGPCPQ